MACSCTSGAARHVCSDCMAAIIDAQARKRAEAREHEAASDQELEPKLDELEQAEKVYEQLQESLKPGPVASVWLGGTRTKVRVGA